MSAACTNAKSQGVTIYTILVMQGSESLLKPFATSPSMYFKITAADQLVTVFNQIGTQMSHLRVMKYGRRYAARPRNGGDLKKRPGTLSRPFCGLFSRPRSLHWSGRP